jgi:hypothetical protein
MTAMKDRFLEDTQWIHIENNIIFSHAGVSKVWLEQSAKVKLEDVNKLPPSEIFGFIPDNRYDFCGESVTQSITWIRPTKLISCNIDGYDQVIGHSPVEEITSMVADNGQLIYACDCLENKQYLVIDNNKFIPKSIL